MKNNIEYYPHYADSDQHGKFKTLRMKYGWAGEGKFWALNNRIAQSENCILNLNKSYNFATIANDLEFNKEEFQEYLNYLEIECHLIYKINDGYTTDIVQEILEKLSKERKNARDRKTSSKESSGELSKSSGELLKDSSSKSSKPSTNNANNLVNPKHPLTKIYKIAQKNSPELSKSSGELLKSSCEQNKRVKESKVKYSKVAKYDEQALFSIKLVKKNGTGKTTGSGSGCATTSLQQKFKKKKTTKKRKMVDRKAFLHKWGARDVSDWKLLDFVGYYLSEYKKLYGQDDLSLINKPRSELIKLSGAFNSLKKAIVENQKLK